MLIRPIFVFVLLMQVSSPALAQNGSAAPEAFAPCSACHSIKPDEKRIGPTLFGVIGRKVGSVSGYKYSPSLAKRQGIWTARELDKYLKNPQAALPGTKMYFGGIIDDARRSAIISYLATLN